MENQENTVPDIPNVHSERFKEEFYKWFEDRGILSNLRSYMRQLMVKALEESNKNGKTPQQRKPATSPKLQAINLLLVDYLFHEDYLYTVSVFASEAEILASLPQYSSYVSQTVRERRWDPSSLPRFSQQETEDILDTLRLPPSQREARHTSHAYLTGHESLLTCIVRSLTSFHIHSEENLTPASPDQEVDNKHNDPEHNHQLWSEEMQDLLLLAGVKLQHIRRMQRKWAQTIEEEKLKAKKEADDVHAEEQAQWQKVTEQRLRAELEEQMLTEQQLLREQQSRVDLREQGLSSLANQLTAVHDDITNRLSQLQLQGRELQEREARQESLRVDLEERLSRLQAREEQQQHALSGLTAETSSVEIEFVQRRTELDNAERNLMTKEASVQAVIAEAPRVGVIVSTQTLDPGVTESTQTLDTEDREQQTSCSSQPDPLVVQQLQMDREKISELQEENLELRAHALQQRHRIDELTNRAASLSSQLEESQVAIAVLSGRESAMVAAPITPPPQPAPIILAPTFGYSNPQRIGAGEESLFAPRAQQATPRSDSRRRPLRFAFSQNPSPTTEESSPTDEVIQQARARIRQLEQESFAVQRSYQEFQTRLLTTDSVMFPPLPSPRIHNPVMRVRRNELSTLMPLARVPYPPPSLGNYHSRFRPTQPRDEENGESSSDQTAGFYEPGRIENVTNSRRMFTQRNIRQYERWKQFKKKFQRRDVLDYSRRNLNVSNSNTSSDEDEEKLKSVRKRQEPHKPKKSFDGQTLITSQDQQKTPLCTNIEEPKRDNLLKEEKEQQIVPKSERKQDCKLTNTSTFILPLKEATNSKLGVSFADKIDKEKLKLGLEKSAMLIQSVKLLLEAPNDPNQGTSTLTNGSLAVESLPMDSGSGSQIEILKTDSSIVTVQSVNPSAQKGTEEVIKDSDANKESTMKVPPHKSLSSQNNFTPNVNEIETFHLNKDLDYELDEEKDPNILDSVPSPLSIPTLRLVSPGLNVESEDFITAVAFNSSDVAEQESGDKGTASVTSGSDILRELNPSKTESSESVLSTGWADDSKHSSDFWN